MKKKCSIKEGIVFAFHQEWNGEGSNIDEGTEEKQNISAYELYAEEKLRRPEYRRMKINIERINRTLASVENSWMGASRHHALKELENLLGRQHELEKETEAVEDVFLREYIYEQLDTIAAVRRSLASDVRWDIKSNKKSTGIE
ncbi:MAG: hypothetical protein Q7J35_12545 [Candidatus Methanoperedens sp.]|nr:hypothetical protein [Candidatus Methanoperedens sp.]